MRRNKAHDLVWVELPKLIRIRPVKRLLMDGDPNGDTIPLK